MTQGKVHLTGTVRSKRSKALAYVDAFAQPGVHDIETAIKLEKRQGEGSEKRIR